MQVCVVYTHAKYRIVHSLNGFTNHMCISTVCKNTQNAASCVFPTVGGAEGGRVGAVFLGVYISESLSVGSRISSVTHQHYSLFVVGF